MADRLPFRIEIINPEERGRSDSSWARKAKVFQSEVKHGIYHSVTGGSSLKPYTRLSGHLNAAFGQVAMPWRSEIAIVLARCHFQAFVSFKASNMQTRPLMIAAVIVSLVAAEIGLSICAADPPSKPVPSNGEAEVATDGVQVSNSQASTGSAPSGASCNPVTGVGCYTPFAQPSRGPADKYNEIDPAFAKFVDLALLTEAMSGPNVAQLTDVALGLAEGERVLVRLHRAGLSADTLMAKVVKLATRANDTAMLERVSKASTNSDRPQWAKLVAEAKEFGGNSRDDPMISLRKIDWNTVSLLEQVRQACDKAELTGEKHILEELKKAVAASEVDPKVKTHATELLESVIKGLSEKPNELDSLLGEFASVSRQYARKQVLPFVSYQDDSLKILFRSSDLEPELVKHLKSMMPMGVTGVSLRI